MSDSIFSDHTGYTESAIDGSTWQVTFAGNEATSQETVDRYTLYRCAEITVEKGYDYFVVMDKNNNAETVMHTGVPMTSTSPPSTSIDPLSNTTTTSTVSTTTQSVYTGTKHSSTKTIRMFKGQRPGDNAQAYDAKSMIDVMSPNISR